MNAQIVLEARAARLRDAAWRALRAADGVNDIEALRKAGLVFVDFVMAVAAAPAEEQTLAAWSVRDGLEGRTPTVADVAHSLCVSAARINRNIAYYRDGRGEGDPAEERMIGRLKVDRAAGSAGVMEEAREAAIRAEEAAALAKRAVEKAQKEQQEPTKDVVGGLVVRVVLNAPAPDIKVASAVEPEAVAGGCGA